MTQENSGQYSDSDCIHEIIDTKTPQHSFNLIQHNIVLKAIPIQTSPVLATQIY